MKLSDLYEMWRIINRQREMLGAAMQGSWAGRTKKYDEQDLWLEKFADKIYKICKEAEKQNTDFVQFPLENDIVWSKEEFKHVPRHSIINMMKEETL